MSHPVKFKPFIDYTVYLIVRLFEMLIYVVPERGAAAAGRFLGRVAFVLMPDRRDAALENLTIAFGSEESPQWIRRTALRNFEHLGLLGVEFFAMRRWSHSEIADRIDVSGRLPFNLALLPGEPGVVWVLSHFGCFEVNAALCKFLGMRLNLIVTGLKNRFLSQYFFSRGGKETGLQIYPHKGVVQEMIELLHQGKSVGFLADQRGDAERGVFVNYFGSPAPANEVFARIAIDGNARVVPLCLYRTDVGRYKAVFEDEIQVHLTGDRHQDMVALSQQMHDRFEKWVRLKPEQGFWVQRKWRRKPSRRRAKRVGR